MRRLFLTLALLIAASWPVGAFAHAMPNSEVVLELHDGDIIARLSIPLEELSSAFGHKVTRGTVGANKAALEAYLTNHVAIRTAGAAWPMSIDQIGGGVREDHGVLEARLRFTRPADLTRGASLAYDAVNREVVSHYALIFIQEGEAAPRPLTRLQSPQRDVVLIAAQAPPAPAKAAGKAPFTVPLWAWLAAGLAVLALLLGGRLYVRARARRG